MRTAARIVREFSVQHCGTCHRICKRVAHLKGMMKGRKSAGGIRCMAGTEELLEPLARRGSREEMTTGWFHLRGSGSGSRLSGSAH